MNIVFSDKKSTLLDTGLTENSFSRSAQGINFTEPGLKVKFNLMENNFQFTPWSFSGTTVNDSNSHVCFEGDGFEGKSVLSILTSASEQKAGIKNRMTYALIKTISRAIDSKVELPANGAGGILYSEKENKKNPSIIQVELLFLPQNLFEFSASNCDESSYSKNQGYWQHKSLTGNNALLFTQSVLAYYTLAEIFPFMKTNTQEREEDIIDSNFIQIENLVNGINETLAANINMGFHIDNQYEREKSLIQLDILQAELGLTNDGKVLPVSRETKISQEAFEKKSARKEKSNTFLVKRKRFFKQYSAAIIVSLIILAMGSNYAYKIHQENMLKPTAKGLDSFRSVELFFSGFHQQNSTLMQLVAKGKEAKEIVDMISNVYVTGTARNAIEGKNATLCPELFLTRPELMDNWIFGITDLTIDGLEAYNRFETHQRVQFKILDKMNLIEKVPDGKIERHHVSYNQIYSSGFDTPITVDRCHAEVTCTYQKDQWYITSISISHNPTDYDQEEFRKDYSQNFKETHDPKETVKLLREKYDWLPDDRGMDDGEKIAEYQKNYFK